MPGAAWRIRAPVLQSQGNSGQGTAEGPVWAEGSQEQVWVPAQPAAQEQQRVPITQCPAHGTHGWHRAATRQRGSHWGPGTAEPRASPSRGQPCPALPCSVVWGLARGSRQRVEKRKCCQPLYIKRGTENERLGFPVPCSSGAPKPCWGLVVKRLLWFQQGAQCECKGMAEFLGRGSPGLPLLGMAVLCIALGIAGIGITSVFTRFLINLKLHGTAVRTQCVSRDKLVIPASCKEQIAHKTY